MNEMDPKVLLLMILLLFVIPCFLTSARAQAQEVESFIPVSGHSQQEPDPGMLLMIQSLLSKQEVILEYFPSDTMLIIIVITKESTEKIVLRTGLELRSGVSRVLKKIRLADLGDYKKQSEGLSEVLLETVAMKLKGKNKAIIIAHNFLNGFPFEALLYHVINAGTHACNSTYFIEAKEVVYNNSLNQWLSKRLHEKISEVNKKSENTIAFAGFSPGFEFHECVQELRDAPNEISTIGRMFNDRGKTPLLLLNENSNENNFKSIACFSHIIHIATHSISGDDDQKMNGLLFNEFGARQNYCGTDDGLLAISEICELRISADLIVLNSCSSANIRSRIGRNWISCADCFMKAGANNVICTLWNVTDCFAERFMVEFYRYFLSGMSFSKALQQVKVKMIRERSTSLPVNWAAYVLIGE